MSSHHRCCCGGAPPPANCQNVVVNGVSVASGSIQWDIDKPGSLGGLILSGSMSFDVVAPGFAENHLRNFGTLGQSGFRAEQRANSEAAGFNGSISGSANLGLPNTATGIVVASLTCHPLHQRFSFLADTNVGEVNPGNLDLGFNFMHNNDSGLAIATGPSGTQIPVLYNATGANPSFSFNYFRSFQDGGHEAMSGQIQFNSLATA